MRVAAVSHRIKREAPPILCRGHVARRRATRCAVGTATHSVSSRGVAKELAKWERKMLRGAFRRCGVITAIAFSAAMFISDAQFNVAEAQGKPRAEDLACGKELQELCSGLATLVIDCRERSASRGRPLQLPSNDELRVLGTLPPRSGL